MRINQYHTKIERSLSTTIVRKLHNYAMKIHAHQIAPHLTFGRRRANYLLNELLMQRKTIKLVF